MSAELVIAGYVRIAKQDLDGARLLKNAVDANTEMWKFFSAASQTLPREK